MIKKTVPDKRIIELLTKEITEYGLEFAKDIPKQKMTKTAFDIYKDSIPKEIDITQASLEYGAHSMNRKEHENIQQVKEILKAAHCTNTMYYAPNSCIDWHTNSDNDGTRVYIIFTSKPGIFRYKDPTTGEIVDDIDYVGWTQREFLVDKHNPLWHCVYSPGPRFAYGFNIK